MTDIATLYAQAVADAHAAWGPEWKTLDPGAKVAAAATVFIQAAQRDRAAPATPPPAPPTESRAAAPTASSAPDPDTVRCRKCGGEMWDNRPGKATGRFKPNAPDWKCKNKSCDGVIWPPREGAPNRETKATKTLPPPAVAFDRKPPVLEQDDDDLPF